MRYKASKSHSTHKSELKCYKNVGIYEGNKFIITYFT